MCLKVSDGWNWSLMKEMGCYHLINLFRINLCPIRVALVVIEKNGPLQVGAKKRGNRKGIFLLGLGQNSCRLIFSVWWVLKKRLKVRTLWYDLDFQNCYIIFKISIPKDRLLYNRWNSSSKYCIQSFPDTFIMDSERFYWSA